MTFLAVRANTVLTTTNTTWSTTANAVDGAYAANSATYAVFTNLVANAVGTIELGFGTLVSSAVGASDTINTCAVVLRHLVSQAARITNVSVQMFDGATPIGVAQGITPTATTARSDTFEFTPTAAQLRSANLKIVVSATRFNGTTAGTFSLDYVDMTVNYGAITKPDFPTLTDSFDALPIDTTKWFGFYGTPTITNGQLAFTGSGTTYTGLSSKNQYNLINSSFTAKVFAQPLGSAGRETSVGLYAGGVTAQQLIMVVLDYVPRKWLLQAKMPGNTNGLNIPYDPIAHAWIRMSSVGATVTFSTSPDGVNWTVQRTLVTALDLSSMSVDMSAGKWSADGGADQTAYIDNLNTLTPPPPAITNPQVVRSGRSASATTAVIDVTNGGTLFILNNQNSSTFTSNDAGVTLLHTDTGGPRRNSIWRIAPGTVGNITFTRSTATLWAYVLVDWLPQEAFATYIGNNTTADISGGTLTVSAPARVGVFWNSNAAADWAAQPAGYTNLDTVFTQVAEPSWNFAVSDAAVAAGAYTTPTYSRGKEATSLIELISVATLVPPPATVKAETLTDTFDTQIDLAKWQIYSGSVVWNAGRAAITEQVGGYSWLVSKTMYDLRNSSVFAKITPPAVQTTTTETFLSAGEISDAYGMYVILQWNFSKQQITFRHRINSTSNDLVIDWDSSMAYVRLRSVAGTCYWDTSPDGVVWTNRRTLASLVNFSNIYIALGCGQYTSQATQSTAYFDDLNALGGAAPPVTTGRPKVNVSGSWVPKPAKVYLAGSWVEKPMKRYVGGQWVKLGETPPWTPATIPGIGLWLEADQITNATNGGPITSWPDGSGLGRHAVPVAAAPLWMQTGINGKPTVKFNNSRLTIPGWGTALSGKSEYTLFQVISQQSFGNWPVITTAPTYAIWQWLTEFDQSTLGVYWGHGNGSYWCYDAKMVSAQPTLLTYSLALPGSGGPRFFKNGSQITATVAGSGFPQQVPSIGADVIFGAYYDGSLPLDDQVAAMIWYDHFLIDSERIQVENYLKTKYGIA